jgi:hypothetical protein
MGWKMPGDGTPISQQALPVPDRLLDGHNVGEEVGSQASRIVAATGSGKPVQQDESASFKFVPRQVAASRELDSERALEAHSSGEFIHMISVSL